MKNYEITVNGKSYQVSVKEIEGEFSQESSQTNKTNDIESVGANQSNTTPQEGVTIAAPMPGRILSIKVKENQSVKAGETVCLLEAMKMENEIVAPVSGIVLKIKVQNSQEVEAGEPLMIIVPS
ncbi:biotin/lipoyl-containing protein [Carnobacterium sp. ISL-102]|uniref:biotin/lipoyl-containing protein n=1 Tax=Carnobacterium TaxID=2747 RepID=UPI001BEABB37|nr:biotin/lipoyl-containing protein [Carnobacterium sp. ISL-102]MBT2732858.1 biotin/lipoyl-binding protein [Carnobacterium sp. ISL-102]